MDMRKASDLYFSSHGIVHPKPTNVIQYDGSLPILLRWKRSIYQMLWKHMIVYALLYVGLSILYLYVLDEHGKRDFKELAVYCNNYSRSINLMIMLGFFTSTAMSRLFSMQTTIPGTAKNISIFITSLIPNLPEEPFIVELFTRWQVLSWVLTFRLVCKPLAKIFPDLFSLQAAGFLTEEERQIMERTVEKYENTPYPLIVIDWMILLVKESFLQGRFRGKTYDKILDLLMAFKKSCGNTIKFSSQNIPPAVIQAVILATYTFGIVTLMGRTFTEDIVPTFVTSYFPLLPAMQFFIYFAWLCFGTAAVDPFGDDEDDIDVQSLVQAHISNSMRIKDFYTRNLVDVFPNLPHKHFNDSSLLKGKRKTTDSSIS